MHLRLAAIALPVIAILSAGCASDYRLVKSAQLDTVNLCWTANEQSQQQLLAQQQQLLQSVDAMAQQLTQNQKPQPKPLKCPEVAYIEAPKATGPREALDVASKQLVGAAEQIRFDSLGLLMNARIDTGIATSVLDARDIQPFERNGEGWVRFTVKPDDLEPQEIERKLARMASLPAAAGGGKKRPVISMRFTLGQVTQQGEFILVDRSASEYPVLLGRLVLRDLMIIDVSRHNLAPTAAPQTQDETL